MWELKFFRGKYCAYAKISGKSVRRSLRTADESLAKQRFKDFVEKVQKPFETIEDIFEAYKMAKETPDNKLMYTWRTLTFFKDYRHDQITEDLCQQYAKTRPENKPSTIIYNLATLRAAIRWAHPQSPARFWFPKTPEPRDRYLTRSEYKKLLEAAEAPHIRLFIIMGLCSAARKTAILQLKWDQVDFERGLIDFGKGSGNKKRAVVPMNMSLERALEEAYKARQSDYVIEYGGNPVKDIKRGFRAAVDRAKLKDVCPHDLRHSAAVWMAEDKRPMSEIAQYLGHTNSATTERVYARYSPEYMKEAAQSLEVL